MFWFIRHFLINRRINIQDIYLQSAHMIFSVVKFKQEFGTFIGVIHKITCKGKFFSGIPVKLQTHRSLMHF